MKGELMRLA